jgi:hypothetical protein
MKISRGIILISILICVISASFCLSQTTNKTSEEKRARALELLVKYTQTQDRLQSFRLKSKDTGDYSWSFKNVLPPFKNIERGKRYYETDFRFDGQRSNFRSHIWGDFSNESLTRDQSAYHSTLWQGKSFIKYLHSSDSSDLGEVIIENDKKYGEQLGKELVSRSYKGHFLMGYFFGDDERVDSILRQAVSISVRSEKENVNGIDCFVIGADTLERGRYTLWIDPEHGYNIAKGELQRDGKHRHKFYDHPMGEDEKLLCSFKNIRFRKIDNIWVPIVGDISVNRTWTKDQGFYREKTHHERYEFVLNPDHEALNSFVPDNIPDGAKVYITSHKDSRGGLIKYTWQDGNVVDANGKVVMSCYKKPNKPNK